MAKSANLYARIAPDVKELTESTLSALSLDMGKMSETEFFNEIQKGLTSIENGDVEPAQKTFSDLRKEFGI
ncbi:MAG: hypothetical protein R3Y24_04565 [Eubacteriales bacterium]